MGVHAKIDLLPITPGDALTAEESARMLGAINAGLSEAFDKLGLIIQYDVALTRHEVPGFRDQPAFVYTGSFKRKPPESAVQGQSGG